MSLMVSVDVKQHWTRTQELYESRGGRAGLPVLMNLTVSVVVKQHRAMLRHWSLFVSNMSTDIRGHEALHHHQEQNSHRKSWNVMRSELRVAGNVDVSDQTIYNQLDEKNTWSRRLTSSPTSTDRATRAARLACSRRHLPWTRQQWPGGLHWWVSIRPVFQRHTKVWAWRTPKEIASVTSVWGCMIGYLRRGVA